MKYSILTGYLRRHWLRYGSGVLLLLATNALALSIPWLLKGAVESVSAGGTVGTIARYALSIIAIALLQAAVRTGSRLVILGASRLVAYDLRKRLFERLLALPPSYYDRMRTGDLMSRAVNDMLLIRSFYGPGVLNFANTAFAYAGSIAIMAWINPRLCLFSLIPYPVVLIAMNRLSRTLYQRSNSAQEQLATISSRVQENLAGMQQVKAFVREKAEEDEFSGMAGEYRRRTLLLARTRGAVVPLMGSISGIGTLAVLWLGGRHVIEGRMTLGDFIAFNSYLAGLAWPTLAMGWIINVFQRGMGAMERIGEVLEAPAPAPGGVAAIGVGPGGETSLVPAGGPPGIDLRDLTFTYPDGARPALAGISLAVPAGSTMAIVGPVGSGKSTLLGLVCGLYAPPVGSLILGGLELSEIPPGSLRRLVAMVPQEAFLFSRTISENIALGRPEASRDEIERVADLSRLSEDLSDFPNGYDTVVGERGITLSGGQRQRVAIARALIVDPAVLLLDDTFSAIDAGTEAALKRNLGAVLRGKTCLIATHRISSVQEADGIVVLDEGRIVERGTHAELLAGGGLYARLYRQQQLEEELERA